MPEPLARSRSEFRSITVYHSKAYRERSDIRPMPDGRIILTDVDGVKYEIPPLDELDERSRSWLEIEA